MLKKAVLHLSILFTFVKGTCLFFETLSVGSVPGIDHSMYITLETSYVFILYIYYLRIKLTGFRQRRPMLWKTVFTQILTQPLTKGTMAATNITRVYAGKIQSA